MSAITIPRELTVSAPQSDHEYVSIRWVADRYGVAPQTVLAAIQNGRLKAIPIESPGNRPSAWAIKPADAFALWAHRLVQKNAAQV